MRPYAYAQLIGKVKNATPGMVIATMAHGIEAAIEAAKGGILFIDEAYSLFTNDKDGDKRDFGNRVIETLLPKLSDDNFGTIVILAGYPAEMKLLLESNPACNPDFLLHFTSKIIHPKNYWR